MNELRDILRSFSDARGKHLAIQIAIEEVCKKTGLEQGKVIAVLSDSGVYVIPDSESDHEIQQFIELRKKSECKVNELNREVAFRFCISDQEAQRLIKKWFNCSKLKQIN